ncbi:MAG: hypothetical protein WCI95_02000 [bacterium]
MMIPDLQMSVLCDDVRQERSGKFILIGLFDVIGMPQFPALFQRVCIVNRWCSGQGAFTEKTRIIGPDHGVVVAEGQEIKVQLADSEATVTNVEFFMNLKFDKEGVYWIEILLDGDLKLRYPLRVNRVSVPPMAQGGHQLA